MGLVDFSKHKNLNSGNIYGLIIKIWGINFLLLLSIQYILANFLLYLYNLFRNQKLFVKFLSQILFTTYDIPGYILNVCIEEKF